MKDKLPERIDSLMARSKDVINRMDVVIRQLKAAVARHEEQQAKREQQSMEGYKWLKV